VGVGCNNDRGESQGLLGVFLTDERKKHQSNIETVGLKSILYNFINILLIAQIGAISEVGLGRKLIKQEK